jgi:hypothetical protein
MKQNTRPVSGGKKSKITFLAAKIGLIWLKLSQNETK